MCFYLIINREAMHQGIHVGRLPIDYIISLPTWHLFWHLIGPSPLFQWDFVNSCIIRVTDWKVPNSDWAPQKLLLWQFSSWDSKYYLYFGQKILHKFIFYFSLIYWIVFFYAIYDQYQCTDNLIRNFGLIFKSTWQKSWSGGFTLTIERTT